MKRAGKIYSLTHVSVRINLFCMVFMVNETQQLRENEKLKIPTLKNRSAVGVGCTTARCGRLIIFP